MPPPFLTTHQYHWCAAPQFPTTYQDGLGLPGMRQLIRAGGCASVDAQLHALLGVVLRAYQHYGACSEATALLDGAVDSDASDSPVG